MSQRTEQKPVSPDRLLEDVRRLSEQDYQAYRRLVEQILSDGSTSLSREVIALAKALGYPDDELLEAVDSCGLVRTHGFLRHEAERRSEAQNQPSEPKPPLVM